MIIAIANQKGGVGKTITAVTLAHGLALMGHKILIIDLDSQGNVADSLGIEAAPDLYRWLGQGQSMYTCITNGRDHLDVIRCDKTGAQLKAVLAGQDFREYSLANALDGYEYDAIILDCAPSVDVLHTAALVAADYLIIPTRLDQFAIKGVAEILSTLKSIQRIRLSTCKLIGILPTFFDRQTRESQDQLEHLASAFSSYLWAPIPIDASCRVANRAGKTLWESKSRRALPAYRQALMRVQELL